MEELLIKNITDEYVPKALENRPVLTSYDERVLEKYRVLCTLRAEGLTAPSRITLREIDLYVRYYPVADLYYFIELMQAIDRIYYDRITANS